MSYPFFQAVVIGLILAWSLCFALRRFAPRVYRGMLARLAASLARSQNAASRKLAARLMPRQVASGGGCGSGGGCASCGTCASASAPTDEAKPLVFHPRKKY